MSTGYKVKVRPIEQRKAQIAVAKNASGTKKVPFHHFRNAPRELEIIELHIDMPIYRVSNFRTRKTQLAYIHQNSKNDDFFSSGQEDPLVQQIQHGFLFEYAQKGSGDTVIPITSILKSEPQTEPLLITAEGVVVNGNRRLSAMREFFSTNDSAFDSFKHVQCMVLPEDATAEDIRLIELRLQAVPQTLLPYEWVNEALLVRDMVVDLGSEDAVAKEMRRRPSDLRIKLLALALGEQYLEWRATPDDFEALVPREQLFADMAKALKDKTGDDLEASRLIGFVLGEHRTDFGTRLYDYNIAFGAKTGEVIQSASVVLGIDLSSSTPAGSGEALEIDIPVSTTGNGVSYKPFIERLRECSKSAEIKEVIKTTCDDIRERAAGQTQGQAALRATQGAAKALLGLDLSKADPSTYGEIRGYLTLIRGRLDLLEQEIDVKTKQG
jgi:hypothetical protein